MDKNYKVLTKTRFDRVKKQLFTHRPAKTKASMRH